MVIDIRTHLIALVAVFLALGLGVLIGISLIGGQSITRHQVAQLQSEFGQLRGRNQTLQTEIGTLQQSLSFDKRLASSTEPLLLAGRLSGNTVDLVVTDPKAQISGLEQAITDAGGTVGAVVQVNNQATFSPELDKALVAWFKTNDPGAILAADPWPQVAAALAQGLAAGNSQGLVELLSHYGILHLQGNVRLALEDLILVGGQQTPHTSGELDFDLPFLAALKSTNVSVVAGEMSTVPISDITGYEAEGVSTVDDLDLLPGQEAAILALSGMQGHYGIKDTAQHLLPVLTPP